MHTFTLLGKEHRVEKGSFGLMLVDGIPIEQFINSLSQEERIESAKKGMSIVRSNPEYASDIADRVELDPEIRKDLGI